MPIRFRKDFHLKFSEKHLKKIYSYRKVSMILTIIGFVINTFIYIAITYIGFTYSTGGHYFDYFLRSNIIDICYYVNWVTMLIASFCMLLQLYSLKFIINPHLKILKLRKGEDKNKIEIQVNEYKASISNRILCQFLIIITIVIELNYYPRNAELFYPFIGCNADTGICVIADQVLFQFILIMSTFMIVLLGLYSTNYYINLKEYLTIKNILNPSIEEKKKEELKEKAKIKNLPIEERRKLKIEQIREDYQKKLDDKKEKLETKFEDKWEKEQFGKKDLKKIKKEEEQSIKEKTPSKKKRDEFDFT